MRKIRLFVIGLLTLWLPLQAIAAVSMPFCQHAGRAAAAQQAVPEQHRHDHSVPGSSHHGNAHGDHQHLTAGGVQPCNNCGACNLACAPAVPVSALLLIGAAPAVQLHFSGSSPGLFVPDQPQPPPNSRL